MAARIKKILHDEDTRAKIRIGNLITRMQRFALAQPTITMDAGTGAARVTFEDEDGKRVWPMTKEQVAVASKLLDKALPNLTSVDVKSEDTKTYVLRAPPPEKDMQTWLQNYAPKPVDITPKKGGDD